jgi:hypothetical protein
VQRHRPAIHFFQADDRKEVNKREGGLLPAFSNTPSFSLIRKTRFCRLLLLRILGGFFSTFLACYTPAFFASTFAPFAGVYFFGASAEDTANEIAASRDLR